MSDWRSKADQDLTAQDVAEMRQVAMARLGMFDPQREMPPAPASTVVYGAVRNDEPVARVELVSVLGERAEFDLGPSGALRLMIQLGNFLDTVGAFSG